MAKILVIDDEKSIRKMMTMNLAADGYEVEEAADGPSGLEVFERERPDVVLLDVRMPDMDGIEVLEKINAYDSDTEVIMITGHGDMEMAIACLRREASNFLTKPIDGELLSIALNRALEKQSMKKKLRKYTQGLETLVREANQQLEKAYKFRENLIENSPDAIVSVRKGGEIVIFNSAAEQMLGYNKEEVIKKLNITEIYPPGKAKEVMKDLRSEHFGGKGKVDKREMTVVHRDGHEIPVYLSASILYEQGQESGSVGIFTDISEKKRLERQLLRSEKLSSLGKLAAGIAHEINQPLTGVLTFASLLLKRHKDDQASAKDLEIIVRETKRIKGIVQGILEFAREAPMQKIDSDMRSIIDNTLQLIERQEKFLGIEVKKEFESDLPNLKADPNLLEQVFMNLFLNAADAMEGQGLLTIKAAREGNDIRVDITDTGTGMAPDVTERIFDPFFTTKDSTEGAGMGLGLAVSYGIINNHGGTITASSQEGKGATFTVRLPLEQ
jgi:PAS domain S-box-containing protein